MNICLVSRELYPFQKAGIGVYVHNLTNSLSKNGHRVFVITSKNNQVECAHSGYYRESNINIIGIDIEEEALIIDDFSLAYSLSVYHQLKKLTTEEEINLIEFADYFGEGFYSLLYKRVRNEFRNIPFVLKLHTPTYECNIANQLKEKENRLTKQEDFVIRNVDYVYAISSFMKETISARFDRKDIEVVYNMIEIPSPSFISSESKSQLSKFILYVGRLEERKGIDIFVKSALQIIKEHPDVSFIIIGQDILNQSSNRMMKEELLELIPSNMQHHFTWKPPMSQEDLMNYYRNAYVSVFPSRFEGFGNVCVEAMRMGSPVIVSNNTALTEIIEGNYGVSFDNGDARDLANQINYLLKNEHYRDELSKLSEERSKCFSGGSLYPIQIEYYGKIINDFKSAVKTSSNEIQEFIIPECIDRIKYLLKESSRVAEQHGIDYMNLENENNRLIREWEKNKEYIELLRDELLKMKQENSRVLNEWEKLVLQRSEQVREYEIQLGDIRGQLDNHLQELEEVKESLKNKQTMVDDLTDKNDEQCKIIEDLKNKNDEQYRNIEKLKKMLQSRKFLIKQIIRKREY